MGQSVTCSQTCCAVDGENITIKRVRKANFSDAPPDDSIPDPVDLISDHIAYLPFDEDDEEDDYNNTDYFARESMELMWIKQASTADGRMSHTFQSGAEYDGQWYGGVRCGFGRMTWPDGAKYIGEWDDNCAVGNGTFVHSDGDRFIGQWKDNMANGLGILYVKGRVSYIGQWRKDVQDGVGIETLDDGGKYEGQFKDGMKRGVGCYTWADGSAYHGMWRENIISGAGAYLAVDGRVFKGQWRDAEIHGLGRYTWPDGNEYNGDYVADFKNGFGIFKWTDGRVFQGFWSNGKQHGHGWYITKDGISGAAIWDAGVKIRDLPNLCGDVGAAVRDPPVVNSLAVSKSLRISTGLPRTSAKDSAVQGVASTVAQRVRSRPEDVADAVAQLSSGGGGQLLHTPSAASQIIPTLSVPSEPNSLCTPRKPNPGTPCVSVEPKPMSAAAPVTSSLEPDSLSDTATSSAFEPRSLSAAAPERSSPSPGLPNDNKEGDGAGEAIADARDHVADDRLLVEAEIVGQEQLMSPCAE